MSQGEPVRLVHFTSDRQFLMTVTGASDLRIEQAPVRVRVQDLITDTCSKLDRNLTSEEWAQHLGHIPYRNTCEHLNPAIVAAHKGRQ